MSVFSAVGRLFGTEKAINNLIDKDNGLLTQVGEWIGNANYTEQEKAKADADHREWGLRQLEALEPFKVVQRILASTVCLMWAFLIVTYTMAVFLSPESVQKSLWLMMGSNYVIYPTMSVFSLYFGGGVISSFKSKK